LIDAEIQKRLRQIIASSLYRKLTLKLNKSLCISLNLGFFICIFIKI